MFGGRLPVAVLEYNFRYLEGLRCLLGSVSSRATIPFLTWIFSISNESQVLSSFYESDRWLGFGIELLCSTHHIITLGFLNILTLGFPISIKYKRIA